MAMQTGDNSK